MKRNSIIHIFLCVFFTFWRFSPACSEVSDRGKVWSIMNYDIHVSIPEDFEQIDVKASLAVKKHHRDMPDTLTLILCKRFIGVHPIHIHVQDAKRQRLPHRQIGDTLLVILPSKDVNGFQNPIRVDYSLVKTAEYTRDSYSPFAFEVSDTLCHINAAITRTDNWYPKLAGCLHDRLPPYRLVIEVPQHLEVMASGVLQNVYQRDNRREYEWTHFPEITDRSLYFFAARCEKKVFTYPDSFQVFFYIPENARQENIQQIADVTHRAFCFFEERFGRIPGQSFKIMSFPYGYSGLYRSIGVPVSLLTDEIVLSDIGYPLRTVIHEVSHTWWGNVVSAVAEEDYWLFEGFAKYSEVKGILPVMELDVETLSFSRLKLTTRSCLDRLPSIREAGKEDHRFLQMAAAYFQGATYLYMLENLLGEADFNRAMRDYVQTYRMTCVNTDDFIKIFQGHLADSVHALLSDHLNNPGYGTYSVKRVDLERKGEIYPHLYLLSNTGDKDIYTTLRLKSDLQDTVRTVYIPKKKRVKITINSRQSWGPVSLLVDPEGVFPVWETDLKSPGGMVYRNNRDQVVFTNVIPHAPLSNAGVRDFMILHQVEGEDLTGKILESLNGLLIRPSGTCLRLKVQEKNDEPLYVTVKYPG